jgi:hypothetical protein
MAPKFVQVRGSYTQGWQNPGFLKKKQPGGFFLGFIGFYWVFLGFIGFYWVFSVFIQLNSFFLLYLAFLITL